MSRRFYKHYFVFLWIFGSIFSLHGQENRPTTIGQSIRDTIVYPKLSKQQAKQAKAKIDEHKKKLAALSESEKATLAAVFPDPAFQGWWKTEVRSNLFGFGLGAATSDIDSYIFIDISRYNPITNPLIKIKTLCGTPDNPRQCTPYDVENKITLNLYYVPNSTSLVNVLDLNGPAFNPASGQSWFSLTLQSDKQTIIANNNSQPQYRGDQASTLLLTKVSAPPPVRPYNDSGTSFPSVSDPVNIAKYIFNALERNHNQPQNIHLNDTDYRSFSTRQLLFEKMLNEGITFETPIHKIRVSRPGIHYPFGIETSSSTDTLTDIFTEGFSYATAGSTVEIKGFKGKWAKLNGIYINGVALSEQGAVPNPSPDHVDISSTERQKKGSFKNVYNHFLLDFDTSNSEEFPRNELGWATHCEGCPVVRVTHRFSSTMEYPEFVAAIEAMFFANYRISQHNSFIGFFQPGSMFLLNTWEELKQLLATDSTILQRPLTPRLDQRIPSGFYNNVVLSGRDVTTYNDPFGLNQQINSYWDYNIVLANYIVAPRNLYWAIAGTPTGPTQFDPTILGYKPLIPGTQPAEFVGTLGLLNLINGKPQPINPNPTFYTIYGDPNGNDVRNSNGYYVGLIDPVLTKGKKVGYLRWMDEVAADTSNYLSTSLFPPQVPKTVKYGREAYCQVISRFTHYLQTELDCDSVILDVRTNNGGFPYACFNLAEFFGDDRAAFSHISWNKKDDGSSHLINLADSSQYSSYNDSAAKNFHSFARFFVSQNETNYGPGAVFRGTCDRHKKVVVLTDMAAASSGDVFPHLFLGENLDGNLGSHTSCKIIGDIDGRLKGGLSKSNPVPVSKFNNVYEFSDGFPYPPLFYATDLANIHEPINGLTHIWFNEQSDLVAPSNAPSLRGVACGAPLPNDWENTVWQDIGLIKLKRGHFSKEIPKQKPNYNNRSTWRDSWLEQAILEAIK